MAGRSWADIATESSVDVPDARATYAAFCAQCPEEMRPAYVRNLRMTGMPYRMIAEETGWRDVQALYRKGCAARAKSAGADADFDVQLKLDLLGRLAHHHYHQSAAGLYQATKVLLDCVTLESKLRGWLTADGAPVSTAQSLQSTPTITRKEALSMLPPEWLALSEIPEQLRPTERSSEIPSEDYLRLIVGAVPFRWLTDACPYREG